LRGENWVCAGGKTTKKECEIKLDWVTNEGSEQSVRIKMGKVDRTLISADKLLDKGNEVILSKKAPELSPEAVRQSR
jgi:hypothetical protein